MIFKWLTSSSITKEANNIQNALTKLSVQQRISQLASEKASTTTMRATLAEEGYEKAVIESAIAQNAKNASTVKLTSAEATELLMNQNLTKEKAESLLIDAGLIASDELEENSTVQLTAAKIREILANELLSESDKELILNALGIAGANAGATLSFDVLTASIWKSIKAMWTFLTTTPIGWGILAAGAIFGLVKAYDAITISVDKAKESLDKFNTTHDEINNKYNEQKDLVEDVADSYTKLSKEVNTVNNQNISLSTEDYKEFISINKQIAEAFPQLISGYDAQGNAILDLGKNGKSAAEELRELLEVEKKLADQKIANDIDEYVENAAVIYEDNKYKKNHQENKQFGLKERLNTVENIEEKLFSQDSLKFKSTDVDSVELFNIIKKSLAELDLPTVVQEQIFKSQLIGTDHFGNNIYEYVFDSTLLTEDQLNKFKNNVGIQAETLVETISNEYGKAGNELKLIESEIDSNWGETLSKLGSTMRSSWSYDQLSDNIKNLADNILGELDSDAMPMIEEQGAENYILNNIILPLKNLPESKLIKIEDLFTKELSTEQFITYVNDIQDYCDENGLTLPIDFIFNIDELKKEYEDAIHRFDSLDYAPNMLEKSSAYKQLKTYNQEGLIDFTNRPVISTDKLKNAGWGEQDAGFATVYSSAFSNEDGTQTVVVTPILPDGTVLSPEELETYANKILNGEQINPDIKMGVFDGEDSIKQADEFSQKIHELHETLYPTSQSDIMRNYFNQNPNIDPTYFNEVTAGAKNATEAIDMYEEVVSDIAEPPSFIETVTEIKKLSEGFDQLDTIYADLLDGENFDYGNFLDNESFANTFGNLTNVTDEYKNAYNEFIEELSNSNGILTSDVQSAFNNLATAYIEHKTALDSVTESTREATIAQLEQMGVANAKQVVDERIIANTNAQALQEQYLAQTGNDLLSVTWEEISAFLNEANAGEVAIQVLARLKLQQMDITNNPINCAESIYQLYALANAAGLAGQAMDNISSMNSMQQRLDTMKKNGYEGTAAYLALQNQLSNMTDKVNASAGSWTDFKDTVYEFEPVEYAGGINSLAAAQKNLGSATDEANDAIKKQIEALEKEKEALEETKSEMEELHDAIMWFYDKQIEKIDDKIDAINEENEALEKQQEHMDDVLAAIESNYDAEIKLIQDKIDALQDENDEEERALALEEAKRKLQEAKSRKTLQVYEKGKGFVYSVDSKAIKEAEEELEELQENAVVEELEKQIEKLEEARDRWSEIPDAYNKAMQEIAASKYFGSDWKNITLFPSDELLNSFAGKYDDIQASVDANEEAIKKHEEEKERIEELKQLWEDAKNAYQYAEYEKQLATFFGSDYEYQLLNNSSAWHEEYATKYGDICRQIEELEERIKQASEGTGNAIADTGNKAQTAATQVDNYKSSLEYLDGTEAETTVKTKYVVEYASGNPYQSATNHAQNIGKAYAKGGIISKKDKGDLDYIAHELGEDHMIAIKEGEAVIPKETVDANPGLISKLINSNGKVLDLSGSDTMQKKMHYIMNGLPMNFLSNGSQPNLMKTFQNIPKMAVSNSVNLTIGDIHVHGVSDTDGLSQEIIKQLPNTLLQKLNKH